MSEHILGQIHSIEYNENLLSVIQRRQIVVAICFAVIVARSLATL
jgi:hypothetical protein